MSAFVSLMYHNVVPNGAEFSQLSPSVTSYFVERNTFEAQAREICRVAQCLSMDQIRRLFVPVAAEQRACVVAEKSTRDPRAPGVQITFDDGWLGSVATAGPILEDYGCTAVLFVTTDLIGSPGFVSRRVLKDLSAPTFTVGSHARTHRRLDRLPTEEVREELCTSKRLLEDLVGTEIDAVSMPGGAIDDRIREIAAELGYRFVFSSHVHLNLPEPGRSDMGRVTVRRATSMAAFRRYLRHNLWREVMWQELRSGFRRLLGHGTYDRVRRRLLCESAGQCDMAELIAANQRELISQASERHSLGII